MPVKTRTPPLSFSCPLQTPHLRLTSTRSPPTWGSSGCVAATICTVGTLERTVHHLQDTGLSRGRGWTGDPPWGPSPPDPLPQRHPHHPHLGGQAALVPLEGQQAVHLLTQVPGVQGVCTDQKHTHTQSQGADGSSQVHGLSGRSTSPGRAADTARQALEPRGHPSQAAQVGLPPAHTPSA